MHFSKRDFDASLGAETIVILVASCQGANVGFLWHLGRDYIFGACSGLHGLLENHPAENAFDPRQWIFSRKQFFPPLKFIVY